MKRWFISTFRKKSAVRIYVLYPDNRIKDYWVLHNNKNVVDIDTKSFLMIKEYMVLKDNIPTYFFNYSNAEPLNFDPDREVVYTGDEFALAIQSHVARDVIMASKKEQFGKEFLITLAVMFLGFMAVIYLMNDKFTALNERIDGEVPIVEVEEG